MLSIAPVTNSAQAYYTKLQKDDYYTQGGEPPGRWHGKGAVALGLTGEVHPRDYLNIMQGRHPQTFEKMTQNVGKANRRLGYDLTFSAPKSYSVMFSQAEGNARQKLQDLHDRAVCRALDYLETQVIARRGKAGVIKEPGKLIIARFEHCTSRALDAQLHSHTVVGNAVVRHDGTTGAMDARVLYDTKMLTGLLYRVELAKLIEDELGLGVEMKRDHNGDIRTDGLFEVIGVHRGLMTEFSTRRQQIERELRKSRVRDARTAERVTLMTRTRKETLPRDVLFTKWRQLGKAFGYVPPTPRSLPKRQPVSSAVMIQQALTAMTRYDSTFSKRDVMLTIARLGIGKGLDVDAVERLAAKALESPMLVALGYDTNKRQKFTTKALLAMESEMLKALETLQQGRGFRVSHEVQSQVQTLANITTPEQEGTYRYLLKDDSRLKAVAGLPGTGKTRLMHAARQAWESSGYHVLGVAPTGNAADELYKGAGIRTRTMDSLLLCLENGQEVFTPKTVLIVDEAGMVSTKLLHALSQKIAAANGKLVLIGDDQQIQSVEAGGAFRFLCRVLRAPVMEDIQRQKHEWAREAVKKLREGQITEVLLAYAQRGLFRVANDLEEAQTRLIAAWAQDNSGKPEQALIQAVQNSDVDTLNAMAQATRRNRGELGDASLSIGKQTFYAGDRVLFTQNSRAVRNGQLATILQIDGSTMQVRVDGRENPVTVDTNTYRHVKLGYAVTSYKSQGKTIKNSYILALALEDRETAYVQMSRATDKTMIFTSTLHAGRGLSRLTKAMENSRPQILAHEYLMAANNTQQQIPLIQRGSGR